MTKDQPISSEELQEFGKRLSAIREHLEISQSDLSQALQHSHGYISALLAGKHKPGYEFFKNLHLKYRVNPEYLFTGKGDMFLPTGKEKKDYGEYNDRIHELLYYIENSPLAKFSILHFFTSYLIDNKTHLEIDVKQHLEAKKNKKKIEDGENP